MAEEEPAVEGLAAQAAALSLQQLDSSLPLWFKPELFLEPDFSPQAYVGDLRRYVSAAAFRRCACRQPNAAAAACAPNRCSRSAPP